VRDGQRGRWTVGARHGAGSWRTRGCWSLLLALAACQRSTANEAPASIAAASGAPPAPAVPVAAPLPSGAVTPGVSYQRVDRLAPGARSGVCEQLHGLMESAGNGLRHFAEVTPNQQGAPMTWSEVRSRQEADQRSPEGTAPEMWSLAEREHWRLAALWASSPSGAWGIQSELCFRPDGTLAELRAEPGTYPRPEPAAVTKLGDLPFASALAPAR
jgi:hypothetical protein